MNNDTNNNNSAPEAPKAENKFVKAIESVGHGIGWFAGTVVKGFEAATEKTVKAAKAATTAVASAARAVAVEVTAAGRAVYGGVKVATIAVITGVGALVGGVARAIWNVDAYDVAGLVWFVTSTAALIFAYAAALGSMIVMLAILAAPALALVSELAPAASAILAYAGIALACWVASVVLDLGRGTIVRVSQRVHASIEQAARDLAGQLRQAGAKARSAGAKMRHALTVDAEAVAAA